MSLGAGHIWRTDTHPLGGGVDVWSLTCVRCGTSRETATARVTRWRAKQKRGKLFEKASFRFHHGRPIGTCRGAR